MDMATSVEIQALNTQIHEQEKQIRELYRPCEKLKHTKKEYKHALQRKPWGYWTDENIRLKHDLRSRWYRMRIAADALAKPLIERLRTLQQQCREAKQRVFDQSTPEQKKRTTTPEPRDG